MSTSAVQGGHNQGQYCKYSVDSAVNFQHF